MNNREGTLRSRLRWLLAGLTAAIYWRVSSFAFINYDDPSFVFANPHVYSGITRANVAWALTSLNGGTAYYMPLTWLTHQLDCQLFGLQPGPQHMTNLWFHAANTLLLFTMLDTLTRKPWRSAVVAALFALHPLHIETVAWISERKTLLCTFFWLLTTLAYIRYVRRGGLWNYFLLLLGHLASLMSKPAAVSLPFTLLLLDYWPLGRLPISRAVPGERNLAVAPRGGVVEEAVDQPRVPYPFAGQHSAPRPIRKFFQLMLGHPLLEKIPLLVITGIACVTTILAQADLGATKSLKDVPFSARLDNAVVASTIYLHKLLLPINLAPFYPLRKDWPWLQVAYSCALIVAVSVCVIIGGNKRRYLLVGWCWYLVTIVPTLGLIQVGSQGMADRYSYISMIGIFVLLVWEVSERLVVLRSQNLFMVICAIVAIVSCALTTVVILPYWQDSVTLFRHAMQVSKNNYVACRQLGMACCQIGSFDEGEKLLTESLRIRPNQALTEACLGQLLFEQGHNEEALTHYSKALKLQFSSPDAHNGLADLFIYSKDPRFHDPRKGLEEAKLACELSHYRKRGFVEALARAYAENGHFREALDKAQIVWALSVVRTETLGAEQLMADILQNQKESNKVAAQGAAEADR